MFCFHRSQVTNLSLKQNCNCGRGMRRFNFSKVWLIMLKKQHCSQDGIAFWGQDLTVCSFTPFQRYKVTSNKRIHDSYYFLWLGFYPPSLKQLDIQIQFIQNQPIKQKFIFEGFDRDSRRMKGHDRKMTRSKVNESLMK